jgi:hypothetical protein
MKNSILVAVDRWHLNSKYKVKVKRTSKIMVSSRSQPSESLFCNVRHGVLNCSTLPRPWGGRFLQLTPPIVHFAGTRRGQRM